MRVPQVWSQSILIGTWWGAAVQVINPYLVKMSEKTHSNVKLKAHLKCFLTNAYMFMYLLFWLKFLVLLCIKQVIDSWAQTQESEWAGNCTCSPTDSNWSRHRRAPLVLFTSLLLTKERPNYRHTFIFIYNNVSDSACYNCIKMSVMISFSPQFFPELPQFAFKSCISERHRWFKSFN